MPALLPLPTTQGKGQPDGAGARKAAEWRGLWVIFGGGLNGAPCEVDIKSDSSSAEVGLRHRHCFCLVMFKCQWERRKKKRKIFFFQRMWKRKSNLEKKTVTRHYFLQASEQTIVTLTDRGCC